MINDREAKNLGMDRGIARRDFISGAAVAVAGASLASLASAQVPGRPGVVAGAAAGAPPADYYPPKLVGLRGQHAGSFEQAHRARDVSAPPMTAAEDTGEVYDLVVVGGGISGLSAAYFFRQLMGENRRVLILDNHDDFGGHAKRNEYRHNGRLFIGYGGTQSISTPYPYSYTSRKLIADIGIDMEAYPKRQDRDLFKGLGSATFFDKEHWGRDKLVLGQGVRPWNEFLAEAPMTAAVRADLLRLHSAKVDYMPDLDPVQKAAKLKTISYQTFLTDYVKITPAALPFFAAQGYRNNMRIDTVPAYLVAMGRGAGFTGMEIDGARETFSALNAHFPDGNATITRLLVNRLIPAAWTGQLDMDSIQTAVVDYAKLDLAAEPVRLRLNATAVHVEHDGDPASARSASVVYASGDKLYRVRGGNVILACFNNIIRFIVPDLPEAQKQALSYASKVPMQYTNVFLRNWKAFKTLGIQRVSLPTGYNPGFNLDSPVSMGDYAFAQSPDDPIVVHLSRNPNKPGLPRKEQNRIGRMEMLATPFETIERHIRSEMGRSLAGGGFDPAEDILGITVNRWPHGYAYTYDTLGDPNFAEHERPHVIGRRPFGRIAIANADAGAAAFTNEAIDQAERAVHDCLYSRGLV
jgi:spermidine dehydrogenase